MADPRVRLLAVVIAVAAVVLACGRSGDREPTEMWSGPVPALASRSGGMTTAFDDSARVFGITARNINHYERQVFAAGKVVFDARWAAELDAEFAGLGPHYDAAACADCHAADGRAAGPAGDGPLPIGFVTRLSSDDPAVVERFGSQLTVQAEGVPAEAVVSVTYEEVPGRFADGEPYSLRAPRYHVDLASGALPDDAVLGVRVAPHLAGLGLLELVPGDAVTARVDPGDADGDGVSGRAGEAVDLLSGEPALGRFGWNASQPTVEQQAAVALFADMGLQSRYFPNDTCDTGGPCERSGSPLTGYYEPAGFGSELAGAPTGAFDGEVTDEELYKLTVYTQALAVPAVRDVDDSAVLRGWELFHEAGCARCHSGDYTTEPGPIQGLSNQSIRPYTDLLLHDLGDGLADRTVGGDPVPTEWRTPPLWGIGLIETVNGHTDLLHDGRARSFSEAILWHGGEAETSADAYRQMSAADRTALIRFLESL